MSSKTLRYSWSDANRLDALYQCVPWNWFNAMWKRIQSQLQKKQRWNKIISAFSAITPIISSHVMVYYQMPWSHTYHQCSRFSSMWPLSLRHCLLDIKHTRNKDCDENRATLDCNHTATPTHSGCLHRNIIKVLCCKRPVHQHLYFTARVSMWLSWATLMTAK